MTRRKQKSEDGKTERKNGIKKKRKYSGVYTLGKIYIYW